MNLELVFYNRDTLLEGPCWDATNEIIYCVSIEQNLIYGINTLTNRVIFYPTNGPVGCAVVANDGFIISAEKEGIYKIDPISGKRTFLLQAEPDGKMRYNDGKLDPEGRFLVGTKGYLEEFPGEGKLYSIENDKSRVLITGTTISNGLDFSPEGDKMYFIDTPTKKVACYDYHLDTGQAVFDKYIIEIPGEGYPDGMCVDLDGMLWVAEWGGGRVCKWNPNTGEKIKEIKLPCKRVTSCCLGGKNLEYLYITTSKDETIKEKMAGGLFKYKLR